MRQSIGPGSIEPDPRPAAYPSARLNLPPPASWVAQTLWLFLRHAHFLLAPHFILGLFVFVSLENRGPGPHPSLTPIFLPPIFFPGSSLMFLVSLASRLNDFFVFVQFPLLGIFFALATVAGGVVARMALDLLRGQSARPAEALLATLRHLPQLLGGSLVLVALLGALVYAPLAIRVVPALFPALLGISAIALGLVGSLSLFVPVVLAEGKGSIKSLRRSWDLTRGRRLIMFGVYFFLLLLAFAIWEIASLAALVFPGPAVVNASGAIGASLGGALFAIASAVAYDLLVRRREGSPSGRSGGLSDRTPP